MASRAACAAVPLAALQNFTWVASAMQRAPAAMRAVEMARYASLRAPLMLFFRTTTERSTRSKTLC